MHDYRKLMRVDVSRIQSPLLFRFTGTARQLLDYLAWAKPEAEKMKAEKKAR